MLSKVKEKIKFWKTVFKKKGLVESGKASTTVSQQLTEANNLLFKILRNVDIFRKFLQFYAKLGEPVPYLIERKKV